MGKYVKICRERDLEEDVGGCPVCPGHQAALVVPHWCLIILDLVPVLVRLGGLWAWGILMGDLILHPDLISEFHQRRRCNWVGCFLSTVDLLQPDHDVCFFSPFPLWFHYFLG